MSQKPKPGAQVRPPAVIPTPVAPSEVTKPAAKAASAKELVAKTAPNKVESAPRTEVPMPEPVVKAEPASEALPVVTPEPITPVEAVEMAATATTPPTETVPAAPESAAVLAEPVEEIAEAVEEIATATGDTIAAATAEVAEQAAAIKPTRPTLTQGLKKMMKSPEELVAFGQANMEAFVKSGQIWSAGMQELTKQMASTAKATFEESMSTFKAMSTAKSVKEALDLQSSFAKAALEKAMAESNKLTDASIKLTEETLAPITARVTVAVESLKTH